MLQGCFDEEWDGYVYPNKNDLTQHKYIGDFDNLEDCRAAALGWLNRNSSQSSGDYECGLNCEKSEYDVDVCEKTLR